MLKIGCHLSTVKGYFHMAKEAKSIGGNTFQFFTRNPRGGKAKPLNIKDAEAMTVFAEANGFAKLLAHAPYTLNACSADARVRGFALQAFSEDLAALEYLPSGYYVFHPGSHVGQGAETGIKLIGEMLNKVLKKEQKTTVLLETMSGKGSEVGRNFAELRAIIDIVELKEKIGVCFDTCHVFDGGYDLVNDLDGVLSLFDDEVGLDRIRAVHLNDSLNILGSNKDRHAGIGKGSIGLEGMGRIINHEVLRNLPFYLETPNELEGYKEEIALLRSMYRE